MIKSHLTSGYNPRRDMEPEWFTGGPTSQSDTIELHGFQNDSEESQSEDEEENRPHTSKLNESVQNRTVKLAQLVRYQRSNYSQGHLRPWP